MFTGIVQELGTVAEIKRARGLHRLRIQAPKLGPRMQPGESVAVNGVCLSVVQADARGFGFEMIPETVRRTNLGRLVLGARVNLESSLSLSDRLNGHLVLGHVDGPGTISRRTERGGQITLEIRVARALRKSVVPKGPIAVDGVSLTVGPQPSRTGFSVFLIPDTLRKTTLSFRRAGDVVNLEVDYLAKLTMQFLESRVGR